MKFAPPMQTWEDANNPFSEMGLELERLLRLEHPAVAISFLDLPPAGIARIGETVPSGCVFWIRAFDRAFYTTAEDHYNCNIGTVTQGFKDPSELVLDDCVDIKLMVDSDYIPPEALGQIPRIPRRYKYITYGPLSSTKIEPDVVLMVCNPEQAMLVAEGAGSYKTMGLPTCSSIPLAMNSGEVAISFGCVTNRARTGIKPSELVVTIPKTKLGGFVSKLKSRVDANNKVKQAVIVMLQGPKA